MDGDTTAASDDPRIVEVVEAVAARVGDSALPAVVGVAGGVGVGKSTFSAALAEGLATAMSLRAGVLGTDSFLLSNAELSRRGLLEVKGHPDTYDQVRLLDAVRTARSGAWPLEVPVYSHVAYDVVAGRTTLLGPLDVLVVEGLTVLQPQPEDSPVRIPDLLDVSIYVDASEDDARRWWVRRFLEMRDELRAHPESPLHGYAELDDEGVRALGEWVWREINGPNLRDHILPSRRRADLVVRKDSAHRIVGIHRS